MIFFHLFVLFDFVYTMSIYMGAFFVASLIGIVCSFCQQSKIDIASNSSCFNSFCCHVVSHRPFPRQASFSPVWTEGYYHSM